MQNHRSYIEIFMDLCGHSLEALHTQYIMRC